MEIKKQILQKINADPAFAAALKEARNAEEVLKVLLAAGFQVTMEDVLAVPKADAAPLSDEELGKAAGGFFWKWF